MKLTSVRHLLFQQRPVLILNLRMNSKSQTGLGKLTSSKLFIQCAVLIDIIVDEPDGGRNQSSQQNDRKQNQAKARNRGSGGGGTAVASHILHEYSS